MRMQDVLPAGTPEMPQRTLTGEGACAVIPGTAWYVTRPVFFPPWKRYRPVPLFTVHRTRTR